MNRRTLALIALVAVTGCSSGTTELASTLSAQELISGRWRSVTPTLEHVRFFVQPTSSQASTLGTRLTFSGVYWDGTGRIEADSVIADMRFVGAAEPSAVLVAYMRDAQTLVVSLRPRGAVPTELLFVRDD